MPELPEVRTVAKTLKKSLLNKKITNIKVLYSKIIENESLDINSLINKTLTDIETKGKYLIFKFEDLYLISHLRMEGKFFIKKLDDSIIKHEHIIFEIDNNISLRYHDTRKFGRMIVVKNINDYKSIAKIGNEPFNISEDILLNNLNKKNIPIKEVLLDQSIMAGLGNIYVNEVLFACNINPLKPACNITKKEANKIITNSCTILEHAIKEGGTTIKSYTSSLGVIGNYQNYLKVHKRVNEKCLVCNTLIQNIKVGGRSTYYCPNCQK